MREIHGTSNALAVKPYNDLMGRSRDDKEEESCEQTVSRIYRETSSKIDNDRPIMFVQFIQMWSSQVLSSDK